MHIQDSKHSNTFLTELKLKLRIPNHEMSSECNSLSNIPSNIFKVWLYPHKRKSRLKKCQNQLWRDSTSPFQCQFNPIQSKLCYRLTKLPLIYQLKVEVLWATWISHEKDIFCSQILLLMVEITFANYPKIFSAENSASTCICSQCSE